MNGWMVGWLSRGELIALGWTLLHFCWQGAAVAAVFAVIDRMTARTKNGVRYVVALGALALMPLMVVTTFAIEMQKAGPSQAIAGVVGADGSAPQHRTTQPVHSTIAAAIEKRGTSLAKSAERLLPWVDGAWMLGVLLLAVRAMGGWWRLEQMRRSARALVPAQVARSFERLCEQMRVGRRVALRVSDEVISPLVMGVWRATVILPAGILLHLTSEEIEAVLAHELGHIRRWDFACNLLQTAVESVLFFHPAVWWISRTVRDRREICCDAIAVEQCAGALVYATALLRLEEQRAEVSEMSGSFRIAVAFKGRGGSLLGRVNKVLGEETTMESKMTSGVRVAVAGAVVVGLLLLPKVNDAVTKPILAASQTAIAQVAAKSSGVGMTVTTRSRTAITGTVVAGASTESTTSMAELASLKTPVGVEGGLTIASAAQDGTASQKGTSYLDGMRDAGYPLDLNKDIETLISMKALGVTPEFAKSMGALGLGKPTVQELISLKALGVTPEYLAALKESGMGPKDFHEAQSEKALGVTPEYAAEMKKAGFADLDVQGLISLKAQGMTPEYATWLKQQFPQASVEEMKRAAVFHLDDKFLAQAKSHGFDGKDLDKLLRLKMSGLLDE